MKGTIQVALQRLVFLLQCSLVASLTACGSDGGGNSSNSGTNQANLITSEPLETSIGAFTFTRPGIQWVRDWDGVYLELQSDEFGIKKGRRVKNLFLNSGVPGSWNILNAADGSSYATENVSYNGNTVSALKITSPSATTGPYLRTGPSASEPGDLPSGRIVASRATIRVADNAKSWSFQGRTVGSAIGSESNSAFMILDGVNWKNSSGTIQLFEQHFGDALRISGMAGFGDIYVINFQFEEVTGFKREQWSSEYVESGPTAGIKWFTTQKAMARTNSGMPYGQEYHTTHFGGELTEVIGETITPDGFFSEPAGTNLCANWNTCEQVAVAVLDGASTNYLGEPCDPNRFTIYLDPRSNRWVYNKTDIRFVTGTAGNDAIVSTNTDFVALGFRAGMAIWAWTPTNNSNYAVHSISSVTSNTITLTSSGVLVNQGPGQITHIMRVPKDGDNLVALLNNGSIHETKLSGTITIPTHNSTWRDHDSVLVTMATHPPSQGAWNGDNVNKPVYFWDNANDLGVTIIYGTGTATITRDFANIVSAGYGFLSKHGLVYKLVGGTSGDTAYELDGALASTGTAVAAAVVRLVSGSGTPWVSLGSHGGGTGFTNSAYEPVTHEVIAISPQKVRITVPANTTVHAVLNQLELAQHLSSPIVTRGEMASRSATLLTKRWNSVKSNDFTVSFDWTPADGATTEKQTLWSARQNANDYVELSIAGSTLTFSKVIDGVPYNATATLSPVAGATYAIEAAISSTNGVTLRVNGVAGTPNVNTANTALTTASTHQLGSINGRSQARGGFKNLIVR